MNHGEMSLLHFLDGKWWLFFGTDETGVVILQSGFGAHRIIKDTGMALIPASKEIDSGFGRNTRILHNNLELYFPQLWTGNNGSM